MVITLKIHSLDLEAFTKILKSLAIILLHSFKNYISYFLSNMDTNQEDPTTF